VIVAANTKAAVMAILTMSVRAKYKSGGIWSGAHDHAIKRGASCNHA
jgi:hypothetical protein